MADLDLSKLQKFAHPKGDALFGYIEQRHVEKYSSSSSSSDDNSNDNNEEKAACFGNFLDAGTGSHSLRWMASILHREQLLANAKSKSNNHPDGIGGETTTTTAAPLISMKSYTAITADETMRRRVYNEATELGIQTLGDVIIGNWNNETLLENQTFDTILVDYLVGAIDGFSPYFQDQIFHRLSPHLALGGRMYIIGLQPIPDSVDGDGNVFCKITKARDACILLANHRCYREYPLDWIERHVERAGMKVLERKKYSIRYDHGTMVRQINVARSKLPLFSSKGLAKEMGGVLDQLEKESLEVTKKRMDGRITLGFDYVVVAEKEEEEESGGE